MSLILKKSGRSPIFILTAATFCLIFGIVATAQSGWLDKGTNILKSISGEKKTADLTTGDISSAFKEALHIGTENVLAQLGQADGFNADSAIHIPLPKQLDTVKSVLSKIGMSQSIDDLELKLNRAAEAATPKAKALFKEAITSMTFEDVQTIYKGPEDSATQYFKGKMTPALTEEMQPIVTDSLSQVGAIQTYDQVMGKYRELPLVPDVKADLTAYVLEKSLDGIFYYVAKEEAAIRENPLKQTTDLLKRVFGAP